MKEKIRIRKLAAVVLAMMMVISSVSYTLAFADGEPEGRQVYVDDGVVQTWAGDHYEEDADLAPEGTIDNSIVINEHLALNGYGHPDSALEVNSSEKDSSIIVDGSVVNNVPGNNGSAVEVCSLDHTASATVTGDAVVQQELVDNDYINLDGTGVYAHCMSEAENSTAKAVASVEGNVVVTLNGKCTDDEYEVEVGAEGIATYTEAEGLSAAVTVGKDKSEGESETADSGNVTVKVTAEGSIVKAEAVALYAEGSGNSTITVQGDAEASATIELSVSGEGYYNEDSDAYAYGIKVEGKGQNSITVNGDLNADITVEFVGDNESESDVDPEANGIYLDGSGSNDITVKGSVNVSVDGTMYSDSVNAYGIQSSVSNGSTKISTGDVLVEAVNSSGHSTDHYADAYARGIEADTVTEDDETGLTEITVGSVTVNSAGDGTWNYSKSYGIDAEADGKGATTKVQADSVSVSSGSTNDGKPNDSGNAWSIGIYVSDNTADGTLDVTVDKSVNATAEMEGDDGNSKAVGIELAASGNTHFATGDIIAEAKATGDYNEVEAYGVYVKSVPGGTHSVEVDGSITANAAAEGKDNDIASVGIKAEVGGRYTLDYVDGKYTEVYKEEDMSADIRVSGDVNATGKGGVGVAVSRKEAPDDRDDSIETSVNIVVGGTISGEDVAAVIYNTGDVVNDVSLTAWAIEANEEDELVRVFNGDGTHHDMIVNAIGDVPIGEPGAIQQIEMDIDPEDGEEDDAEEELEDDESEPVINKEATAAFEKKINYIIKYMVDQLSFSSIKTENDNSVTIQETEYHTANEEENITISLEKGQTLEGVYYNNDEGDKEDNFLTLENKKLTIDANGNYLIAMRRGGGMLLGLKLHKHKMTAYPAKDPTCDKDGNTAYWYCPDCGKYFSDAEGKNEIPKDSWILKATGHKLTAVPAKDPTCDEDGNTAYWYCENCGKFFADAEGKKEIEKDSWILKATGHKLTKVDAKEATATEDGNTEYWYCEVCGKYYADAEGTKEIKKDSWIIKATGKQESDKSGAGDVAVLLKIRDTTGTAEISFLSNGYYKATFADGSKGSGKFTLKDGAVVLEPKDGAEMQISPDAEGYKLVYPAGEETLEFLLTEDDMKILEKAAK